MNQFHDTGMTFNHGPCRPQQRVGNPLQQMVFTPGTESADRPAQAAKRNTKRIVTSALSDATYTGTHPHGDWRNLPVERSPLLGGSKRKGKPSSHQPNALQNTVIPAQAGIQSGLVMPTAAEASQTETELDNPTSPVPAPTQTPAHDCYIDQHGNCPAADTELCDLHCPYRDEN